MKVGQTAFVRTRGTYGSHGTIIKVGQKLVHVRYLTATGKAQIRRIPMGKLKNCAGIARQDWEEIGAIRNFR